MRTSILTTLTLTLAATMLLGSRPAAADTQVCQGRYSIEGAGLDLGPNGISNVIVGADAGAFSVHLAPARSGISCDAAVVTTAPRSDAFILRARFVGCGERPRFRLRLAFDQDCGNVSGRQRAAGQLIAEFSAGLVVGGNPLVPGTDPTDPTPPTDPTVDNPTPPDPTVDNTTPIGDKPRIASFSSLFAHPGDTISVFGSNLDHDKDGNPYTGTPPFLITFLGVDASFGRLRATPAFVSDGEVRVTIPSQAVSGTLILAERRSSGLAGPRISETSERLVVVRADATPNQPVPTTGSAPATQNNGTLHVQASALSLFNAGDFPVSGPAFQIGAFLDANNNHVVDLFTTGRNDVPYLAFPVRTSDFDFSIEGGRGYFAGANAMLWVFFEGGNPSVLDNTDQFFVVHLNIDLANRTARPIAMLAGVAGDPGVVMMADQFASETNITVAQPGAGVGAIKGRIAAVPTFLQNVFIPSQTSTCIVDPDFFCPDFGPEIQQNLWANGITIDFDVPLFADGI